MLSNGIGNRFTKYVGHIFSEMTFRFCDRIFSLAHRQWSPARREVPEHDIHINIDTLMYVSDVIKMDVIDGLDPTQIGEICRFEIVEI